MTEQIENKHTVGTNAEELPYNFDLLYDIKTQEQLQNEVNYLARRLGGIAELCRDDGQSVDAYVASVLGFPNERKAEEQTVKAPEIYTLHKIVDKCTLPRAQVQLKNGKWYPSRPLAMCTLRERFERAWLVFTGRADVVIWEEQ